MIKKTNTFPAESPKYHEKAANSKFTAFSISSMHMKMIIAFLLKSTPSTPMQNNSVLKIT